MVSRRLYQLLGMACGFVLIDYGFNFIAEGLPGARAFTSQFVGVNFLLGGSAAIFMSLYYLLKPMTAVGPADQQTTFAGPDVGVETIVEEETPPKSSFYRNIEYIGYFFTILGLFSAADLVLQVFIRSMYNELRWWVEILLVTFGVLSYTIFGSVGRLGSQEEAKLTVPLTQPTLYTPTAPMLESSTSAPSLPAYPDTLDLKISEFTRNSSGEYEHNVSAQVYDMFRVDPDMIVVWREDRKGIRSIYLAGPYELSRSLLAEQVKKGEDLKLGSLSLSVESINELLALQGRLVEGLSPTH